MVNKSAAADKRPILGRRREGQANAAFSERVSELESYFDTRYAAGSEERVNMRWGTRSLEVVRRAAEMAGVPYQTYVKQTAFRQALSDLRDAATAGVVSSRTGVAPQSAGDMRSSPEQHPEK